MDDHGLAQDPRPDRSAGTHGASRPRDERALGDDHDGGGSEVRRGIEAVAAKVKGLLRPDP